MAAKSPWIVETTERTFEQDVVERSREVPVVVDFWAAWCQPCRMLGPILERLAEEFQGNFVLVKANTEEMPSVAAALGVQAIPAVFGLREGKVVDQFVGVMSESQIRSWLQRVLPSPAENLAAQAKALEAVDPQGAEAKYREAIGLSPNQLAAQIGLARMLLARGELEESRRMLEDLAVAGALDAEGERLYAETVIREYGRQCGTVEACRTAADADPAHIELQLKLARALAAAGQHEEAMEICLAVVQKDRKGLGEAARGLMVHLFHLLGPDSELAGVYRRKLAMALY